MNNTAVVRIFLALIVGLVWLSGCNYKSPPTYVSNSNASIKREVAEPEKAVIEKISGTEAANAAELVTNYNARDTGSPGWRRVSMELVTNGTLTREFTVVNIWRSEKEQVDTLFLLEEPGGLGGTNYLLQERSSGVPEMSVHLFLPAGERRVLEVDPSSFEQGLLGSDFSYNDVRMRLPVVGLSYRLEGRSVLQNQPVWVLEAEPSSELSQRSYLWKLARFYLARNFQLVLGADYFSQPPNAQTSSKVLKQMRVQSFEDRSGVLTPTKMFMTGSDGRSTTLVLKDAQFRVANLDSSLFAIDNLPALAERVKQGWSPQNH